MPTVNLKDARTGFSKLVDQAIKGEFVTITRHGKAVAALVSVEAAEIARNQSAERTTHAVMAGAGRPSTTLGRHERRGCPGQARA